MSWVVIALVSAAVQALVSMFDKTVLHRYANTPMTLPFLVGCAQTTVGIMVISIASIPEDVRWSWSLWALISGILFGISGQFLMRVLYRSEVSRTVPITQTTPLFAAILALMFLGETISLVQWAAIVATVAGATCLSLQPGQKNKPNLAQSPLFLLMFGALIFAAGNVIGKAALEELPLLYTHGLRSLGLGGVFLAVNMRSAPIQDVLGFIRTKSPALIFVGSNELVIANAGLLLMLWALAEGPVSLVTALLSTRALFVVLFSTTLALVWKGALGEETTPRAIGIKIGSTMIIVTGVAGIALS